MQAFTPLSGSVNKVSRKSTSGMTNRQQGIRFVSIRSNPVESTTFWTHPQRPDALYFLSLAQIDFRYDESTARDTIRVESIESCQSDNILNPPSKSRCAIFSKSCANRFPVWRIDSKGHDFTLQETFPTNRVASLSASPNRPKFVATFLERQTFIYHYFTGIDFRWCGSTLFARSRGR